MATIVNNPGTAPASDNSGMGTFFAVLLIIIAFFAFLFYGLPRLRNVSNVPAPAPAENNSGSEINVDVPEQIDINTNPQPQQ
jgi:flagellar biogenesis protein FliO